MNPIPILKLEGLALLATAIIAFHNPNASWGLFAAIFLAPYLFALGYLANRKVGALLYNAGHTYFIAFLWGRRLAIREQPSLLASQPNLDCPYRLQSISQFRP